MTEEVKDQSEFSNNNELIRIADALEKLSKCIVKDTRTGEYYILISH